MNLYRSLNTFALISLVSAAFASSAFGGLFDKDEITRKAKKYRLVPVKIAVPGISVDLQYAKTSASGKPLYKSGMVCLINDSTGKKLRIAQAILKKQGYSIKVWDAWRPPEAHIALWNAVKDPKYVVPPSRGLSWHCYGVSVDITLVTSDGKALKMPTEYDNFTNRAASNYVGGDANIAKHVQALQAAMREAGFSTIRSEWWHFDDHGSRSRIRKATAADLGISMP